MAGLRPGSPLPESITVHEQSRVLEVGFSDGKVFRIPFELMRVYSPSAEVQGHGPGQEVLQTGKRNVTLVDLEPVGNYAVKPTFSDGHDSGIFSWDLLYELGANEAQLWAEYEFTSRPTASTATPPCPRKKAMATVTAAVVTDAPSGICVTIRAFCLSPTWARGCRCTLPASVPSITS